MIRHVVLFEFKDGVDQRAIDEMEAALRTLPSRIGTIESYTFGRDLGLSEVAVEYAVVADFATPEGYMTYRDHPAHQDAVAAHVTPIVAKFTRIQFEIQNEPPAGS